MTFRLPLFPLGVVLFPGALLPLHIFEPRYRRLLADTLAGDSRFGLALPGIAHEAPAIGAVGCVAELRGTQELPDGRSNIVVQGSQRFLVTRYLDEPAPYLVAMVEAFDDREGTVPSQAQRDALAQALTRYVPALHELKGLDADPRPLPQDPVELSFHAASVVECDLADKQLLLDCRSTAERVERLLQLLPGLTTSVEAGLRQRQRARGNGRGPHHDGPQLP